MGRSIQTERCSADLESIMKNTLKTITIHVLRGVFISATFTSVFVFIHRVVLNKGGSMEGNRMVHEDMYGIVLFLLFAGGLSLSPLPRKRQYILAGLRSALLTAGALFCVYILVLAYPRSYFHADAFLTMLGITSFGSLLLSSRPFLHRQTTASQPDE